MNSEIQFVDLAVFLPKEKTLVITDIHIGYEEELNKKGVLIPRTQFPFLMKRTERILNHVGSLDTIVIAGDLKHEFGTISETEWRNTLRFLDLLAKHTKHIILIKGNHDTILGPIAKKRNVVIKDAHRLGSVLVLHGDSIPKKIEKGITTLIIGHDHPAISVGEDVRTEKYKCFLVGKYKKYGLIVMPSLNPVTEGTDVSKEKLLSPFLRDVRNFSVYVVADLPENGLARIFPFGKVKDHMHAA
ncbi:metallophosphoesterase [Candidatus Woesearchaeota archaeon]|nr:metallophosphoesterase [Candidatus Woesearchaeota archaeon]